MAAKQYSWRKVEDKVREIISAKLNVHSKLVTLDTDVVKDLGADSLDQVELIMAFEDEFNINISEEILEKMTGSIKNAIQTWVNANPYEAFTNIDRRILSFRMKPNGRIEVSLQYEDGSWTFVDGVSLLPSKFYFITFSRWGQILKELEALVNDPKTKEADLQNFFEANPELFTEDNYDRIIPQASIVVNDNETPWRADFVLTPIKQTELAKIIELKLPAINLINKPKSGHFSFSAKILKAIAQLKDYYRAFDNPEIRSRFESKYGTYIYKPELHLVAGRSYDLNWVDKINELRSENNIRIEDWDSLIDRLKRRYK